MANGYPGGMGGGGGADLPGTLLYALQLQNALRRMQYAPEEALLKYEQALPGFEGLPEGERQGAEEAYLQYQGIPRERSAKVRKKYQSDLSASALDELGKLEEQFGAQQDTAITHVTEQGLTPGTVPEDVWAELTERVSRQRQRRLQAFAQKYGPALRDPGVAEEFKGMQALYGPKGTQLGFQGLMFQARGTGPRLPFPFPGQARGAQEAMGRGIVSSALRNTPLYEALAGMGVR